MSLLSAVSLGLSLVYADGCGVAVSLLLSLSCVARLSRPLTSHHHFPTTPPYQHQQHKGALIPSLRRTDRLGERFNDEQIDAILDSVQNFLLGLSDGGMGGGGGGGGGGGDMDEEEQDGGGDGGDAMEEDYGGGGGGGGGVGGDDEEEDEF